jgi:UDP-3-O-[3-hydroxymyristoyl] glucosamine N-acyltransferase
MQIHDKGKCVIKGRYIMRDKYVIKGRCIMGNRYMIGGKYVIGNNSFLKINVPLNFVFK